MPSLTVTAGPGSGEGVFIGEKTTLGRSSHNTLIMKTVEASRHHADIVKDGDRYCLRDLGSSNGTYLNDVRVHGEMPLADGDEIRIGNCTLLFRLSDDLEMADITAPAEAAPPPPAEPATGELTIPGYAPLKRIRDDYMTQTFGSRELSSGNLVEVEILNDDYSLPQDARVERLRQAAAVTHSAVTKISDVGQCGERVYFVREITGRSLWRQCGKLTPQEITNIGVTLADCLAAAHDAGLVHGVIRPDRVVRTKSGELKLLGLGLPHPKIDELLTEPDLQSRPNRIAYMSPELLKGGEPTAASDIYALGAVLYNLVAGRPPFMAINETDLAKAIQSQTVQPLEELRQNTPRNLSQVILKMLSREPGDRYESMAEVKSELEKRSATPQVKKPRARRTGTFPLGRLVFLIIALVMLTAAFIVAWSLGEWFIRQSVEPGPWKFELPFKLPFFN